MILSYYGGKEGNDEIKQNTNSIIRKYSNGKHSEIKKIDVISYDLGTNRHSISEGKNSGPLSESPTVGVIVLCHASKGRLEPDASVMIKHFEKLFVEGATKDSPGTLFPSKINIAACEGAGNFVKIPQETKNRMNKVKESLADSGVKRLCEEVIKCVNTKKMVVKDGTAICGYTTYVVTFDLASEFTNARLNSTEHPVVIPPGDSLLSTGKEIRNATSHNSKFQATHSKVESEGQVNLARKVFDTVIEEHWQKKRHQCIERIGGLERRPEKYRSERDKHLLERVKILSEIKGMSYKVFKIQFPQISLEFYRQNHEDIYKDVANRIRVADSSTADVWDSIKKYIEHKVAFKFNSNTKRFYVCSLKEYTDNKLLGEMVDIVWEASGYNDPSIGFKMAV